jgi:gliding motility-associated-like protein
MKKIFTLSLLFVFSLSFSQTFVLPSVGVQSTYCGGCPMGTCSGTLLDPGGAGVYPNNVNQIYQTFCPTTPGNCLRVTFTAFDTELGYDFVTVGNGPAQNSAVFNGAPAAAGGQIWGTPTVPFSYTANNTSGCLTFRFNSDNIFNYAGFTASLSCIACTTAQATGNSDACASTFICSNLGFNDISNGPGLNPTEGCGGSNCVTGENYSNWYTFTAATTGALTFTIDPNVNAEDFDFAVFGPNPVCGALGAPLRCSYAANSSFTGLGSGAIDNSEDVFGNGWVAPMNVTAGQTYMLMVNNWTAGGAGFNILFGGATLGVLAPVVNSPSVCAGQSAVLTATPTTTGGTYTWSPGGLNTQSISVSPGSTTSYSVIYSTGGCTSGASTPATVTVVNLPTANAGSGANLTCIASTAVLSGSGGGTYVWSGPGITGGGATANPTVNSPGTYSLSVTASGCTSTISTVAVTQNITPPTPTASNSTTLSCNVTTAALTGGPSSGVTYQWSGPGLTGPTTAQNATATAPGNYTLTVTDNANGCTATAVTTVSQNTTAPTAGASSSTGLTCSTTTVSLTGTGGGTYSWLGSGIVSGAATANPVVNAAGTYTVLVTAANGCTATANTTVSQNTTAPTAGASASAGLNCNTTTVTLTGTGGGSYSWTGSGIVSGAATANPVVNTAGTYSVLVTAANGCTATANTTVSQNTTAPTAGASNSGPITCTITTSTLTATGGGSYLWTGPGIISGATTANPVVNQSGNYLVTVTAANGCTAAATTSVSQNASPPAATASGTTILNCTATTSTLTGTGGGSYSWSGAGIVSGGSTANPVVNAAGIYTVMVTAANGCTATANTSVTQNTTAPSAGASNSTILTCATTTAALTGSGGGTYNWSGSGIISGGSTANPVVNAGGTYTVLVTAVNGCTATANTTVTQNTTVPAVTVTNSGPLTCTTTSVLLACTSGSSYIWAGPGIVSGSATSNPSANLPGTYDVTLTASNGCTATANTTVLQNTVSPGITMPATQTITCTSPTVALIGSANPTTCIPVWTGGACAGANTYTASACSPNTYTLTVTDPANGCVNSGTVDVVPSSGIPVVTTSNTGSITCAVNTIEVMASTTMTPVSYSWTGPGITAGGSVSTATVNTGGTYQCVVANTLTGCSSTVTTVVSTDTTAPTTTISASGMLTCLTTTVDLTSTLAGMNYTWTPPIGGNVGSAGTQSTTAAGAGDYTLTVIDPINGCSYMASLTVIQNTTSPAGLTAGSNQTLSCSSSSVTLTGNIISPANAGYLWTGPGVCGTATLITTDACSAGFYTLTATDPANGCVSSAICTVFANAGAPTATVTNNSITLDCLTSSSTVTVTSTPNTDITYSWSSTPSPATVSANGNIASFTTNGVYLCTVTNTLSNCSTAIPVSVVTNTTAPAISVSATQTLTCAAPTAVISTTTTPGSGITYTWTGTVVSGQGTGTVSVNTTGTYSVMITDAANGCTNTASSDIVGGGTTIPVVSITAASTNSTITCSNPSVTLLANVTPVTATYSYTWSPGGNGGVSEIATSAGVYNVVVLNAATGCTATAATSFTVTGNTTPPTIAVSNTTIPCGSPSVTIGAIASNASYNWTTSNGTILSGGTTFSPVAGSAGDYMVTVTDNTNGCVNTATVTVTSVAVTAAFTANPTSGTAPLLVNFTNQTPGVGNIYAWNFADDNNNTSVLTNPDHTYNTTGNYIVTLLVTDASGLCSATATLSIDVFDNSSIIVPNVFTPNNDEKNDIFRITTTGMKDLNCDIFNRWGTKVANISGVNGMWDGGNVNDGTFFFILTATGFDGTEYKQQGYINVFK